MKTALAIAALLFAGCATTRQPDYARADSPPAPEPPMEKQLDRPVMPEPPGAEPEPMSRP